MFYDVEQATRKTRRTMTRILSGASSVFPTSAPNNAKSRSRFGIFGGKFPSSRFAHARTSKRVFHLHELIFLKAVFLIETVAPLQ